MSDELVGAEGAVPATTTKKKSTKVVREPIAGGVLPEIGDLFGAAFAEFMENIAGYAIMGLVRFAVSFPLVIICIMLLYTAIFAVYFGGVFGSLMVGGLLGSSIGGDAGDAVGIITILVGIVLTLVAMVVASMLAMSPLLLLAPLNAGAYRATAKHQKGEITLKGTELFSYMKGNTFNMVMVEIAYAVSVAIGLCFMYVGALVPVLLFMHAPALVAVHGLGWMDAMKKSASHSMKYMSFHGVFSMIYLGCSMFAGYLPIVGPAFLWALYIRTYREQFGDGPEPEMTASTQRKAKKKAA